MAGLMFLISQNNVGGLIGTLCGMAVGGPAGAAIGNVVGKIAQDKLMTGRYNAYGIAQNFENIRRHGIARDTLRNVIEMIPPICGDMLIGYHSGTSMASMFEDNRGQVKREDDIMKENSESKKEMSDTTHSNPEDVKKGSTDPNMMPLKARKRPGSSQEQFPDTKRFKPSELTVTCCSTEKNQTICTRLGRISSSPMASI